MDVVMIGSGNVAYCFSHLLRLNGHKIMQVVSRNREHARELAEKLNTAYTSDFSDIELEADVYLVAVSDSAIAEVADCLRLGKRLVAHTAGAVDLKALQDISSNIGVIYPLQMLRKEDFNGQKIPLLIEGNNPLVVNRLEALGAALSDDVIEMTSDQRLKMHLAAVFCNNFPNYLAMICKIYCAEESLDYKLLYPILRETYEQMTRDVEEGRQTGPARRGDQLTLEKHERLLEPYPEMKKIYQTLSRSIQNYYKQK